METRFSATSMPASPTPSHPITSHLPLTHLRRSHSCLHISLPHNYRTTATGCNPNIWSMAAGHIFLVSCLLAICLPIIFVQLPRFEAFKDLHAEKEAEKRSEVLPRRPLSSPRKALRRTTRPWSETDIETTGAESEQEQIHPAHIAQGPSRGRWDKENPGTLFGADACADGGASSKEEELRKARAGKKPWDRPFRRPFPRTELVRKSPGGAWHAVTDAPLPRKTGRDMEARGVAVRLFPPDPVPESDDVDEYDRWSQMSSAPPSTPQEPLSRRPPPKSKLQPLIKKQDGSPPPQPQPHSTQSASQQQAEVESIPSSLDRARVHHTCHQTCHCHTPASISVKAKEHVDFDHAISQAQSNIPISLKDFCHTYSKDDPKEPKGTTPESAPKEASRIISEEAATGSSRTPRTGLPLWQVLLLIMGSIIFVFAFAVLIAHCLAWFLVYKTEARLSEVRSGLFRGGEMKLCLCGRG